MCFGLLSLTYLFVILKTLTGFFANEIDNQEKVTETEK